MKHFFSLPIIILLTSCASQPNIVPPGASGTSSLRAIGARNSAGVPTGEYRIVDSAGYIQAQGRFLNGKMDSRWVFFDSHRIKVAEITYRQNIATGPYRTYFGSIFNSSAAGRLESTGFLKGGRVTGEHIAFSITGVVFSKAIFETGNILDVKIGSEHVGLETAASDMRFVRILESSVRSAVQ